MDARLNLEGVLQQGLIPPLPPSCYCSYESGGPEMDCPEHGSIQFYAHQCNELMTVNYLLAKTIRNIKGLADDLADDGDNATSLLILGMLGEHLDLTPPPEWSPLAPWDDAEGVPPF